MFLKNARGSGRWRQRARQKFAQSHRAAPKGPAPGEALALLACRCTASYWRTACCLPVCRSFQNSLGACLQVYRLVLADSGVLLLCCLDLSAQARPWFPSSPPWTEAASSAIGRHAHCCCAAWLNVGPGVGVHASPYVPRAAVTAMAVVCRTSMGPIHLVGPTASALNSCLHSYVTQVTQLRSLLQQAMPGAPAQQVNGSFRTPLSWQCRGGKAGLVAAVVDRHAMFCHCTCRDCADANCTSGDRCSEL